jgi:hypothetical protein
VFCDAQACRYGRHCRDLADKDHRLLFLHPTPTTRAAREQRPQTAVARGHHHGHGDGGHAGLPEPGGEEVPVVEMAEATPEAEAEAEAKPEAEKKNEQEEEEEEEEDGGNECIVCFDAPKDSLLYPCGHVALCQAWYASAIPAFIPTLCSKAKRVSWVW